jgi:hypothetical protein
MSLRNTTISLTVNGGEDRALGSGSTTASFPGTGTLYQHQITLQSGTGVARAQKVGLASFGLTGGASVTLDLTAFAGPFGTVNFSLVKECVVDNGSTDATNVLEVGNAGSNPWLSPFAGTTPRVLCHPGASIRLSSPRVGFAVSGTNKSLKITNTGAGTNVASGNVLIIGEGT